MKPRQLFRIVAAIALIFGWAWAYQLLFREQFYTWAKALPFGLGFPVAALIFLAGFAMLWAGGALIYKSFFPGDAA